MTRDRLAVWLGELGISPVVVAELISAAGQDGYSAFMDTPAGRVCVAQVPDKTGARSGEFQVTVR